MCGFQPWQRFESDYKAGRKSDYNKEKERWTSVLMKKVEEKAILGLSSMVEVMESATPLTNWRYTRNPGGAIYGFEQTADNAFMNRIKNRVPFSDKDILGYCIGMPKELGVDTPGALPRIITGSIQRRDIFRRP
jgi:phytoene dehydrogenase-like protein